MLANHRPDRQDRRSAHPGVPLADLVLMDQLYHDGTRHLLQQSLPPLLDKALRNGGKAQPRLKAVSTACQELVPGLTRYLERVETLRSYLLALDAAETRGEPLAPPRFDNLRKPLRQVEIEREICRDLMMRLKTAARSFLPPRGCDPSVGELYRLLAHLLRGVEASFALEAEVLHPRAVATEDRLLAFDPDRSAARRGPLKQAGAALDLPYRSIVDRSA